MDDLLHQLGLDDPRVMAAQVTGFILLWILLKKYLFRPVLTLLSAREAEVRATYQTAESEREKGETFRDTYEKRLAAIESEARAKIQTAIKEGEDARNEILAEASERAEEILRQGQEDLALERQKTISQLREEMVDISLVVASKLIQESLDEKKHRDLVNDFINKVGTEK